MKKIFFAVLVSLLFIPFISIQAKEIVIKNDIINGTITVDKTEAEEGETVTLTIVADEGYQLKSIQALDKFDEMPVTIDDNSFVMPNYNVFISAEFEKIDENIELYNTTTTGIGASQSDEETKSNTLIYVVAGVGVLLVGSVILIILKKKSK